MDQIKINVNGIEKLASGLSKETTVQDIKFAMLYSTSTRGRLSHEKLNEYGLFEQWQSNERLLDSNVKIYKIIKMWKQVPGDQLSKVKFIIRKKCSNKQPNSDKQFKFCSLSPSVQKAWNRNKCSYLKKQFENLNNNNFDQQDNFSVNSIPSSAWSSANEDSDDDDDIQLSERKRYASVRRSYRSRNSSIKRINLNFDDQEKKNKLDKLNQLKNELNQIKQELANTKQSNADVETMKNQLKKIDNLILIKNRLISSLEKELQRLSTFKCSLSSSSSSSSISSADTGISSAHSDDDQQSLETLV